MFDLATFGKMGVVPGWPGEDVCPPQPMIQQIRHVLDNYAAAGGIVERVVIADCGHTPFVEKATDFNRALHNFLEALADPRKHRTTIAAAIPCNSGRR